MVRNFIVAIDACAASKAAVEFLLHNLAQAEGDTVHLIHCYKRLQPLAGQHFAYVPSGGCGAVHRLRVVCVC